MKRKSKILLLPLLTGLMLWLPLAAPMPLYAQGGDTPPEPTSVKNFRFEYLTPEEGLPSLTVRSIVQDQQGFMWFATSNGLSRYNGYTFTTFRNDPNDPHSISTESFGRLYVDRQGVLWVGTWNGGLNVFDRTTEQFTRYLHNPDDPSSLSHNRVNVILEDKSGRLWLGTEGGLNRFDPASEQFFHYQHDPNDPHSLSSDIVKTMVEDASGQLWLGTFGGGVNKFDPASGQFTPYQNDPQNPNSLIYDNVEAIAVEATGSLWIGTKAGLDYFDPATGQFTHYHHNPADPQSLSSDDISELYLDASGEMWIGTAGGGLNIFDPQTKTFRQVPYNSNAPYGFHGDWVSTIYADRSGALWIATLSDGVNRLDRAAAKFELYQHNPDDPTSLSPGAIWSILRDHSGTLWVASVGGGLNKFDPVTGYFEHYRHDPADLHSLSNDSVFAMTEDATGDLWIGTMKGLNRYDQTSGKFTQYIHDPANPASLSENWVAGLYADRSGRLWVGTIGKGLDRYDPATDSFRHYQADPENPHSISDNNVLAFAEDPAGQLWIGTISGGLNKFDPETETFTHYLHDPDDLNSLIDDNVSHIYLDSAGVLWLATPKGLEKFDPQTEIFTHYTEQQGLASKALASVVGDAQGNLWVGMQGSGLARFDPRSETFKNYDKSDGLQSNDFIPRAAYRDADGKLYFGGMNGLNAFYPDQLRDNPYVPPVVLTGFQIFNHPVPIGEEDSPLQQVVNETDEITLSYQQSVFSFEFAALNYRAPKKNQYAYKLEGFDQDWNYVDSTRRFATYTSLNPGAYTFRVKASNNDGVWNEEGKAIKITITPPWWQTWWFYTISVLAGFGLVLFIYRLQLRARTNQLKAEKAVALNTVNVISQQLTGILQLNDLLRQIVTLTKETFNYYHVHIYLLNEGQDALVLAEGYGRAGEAMKRQGHHIPLAASTSLVARAVREGQIVISENVQEDPTWLSNPLLPQTLSEMAVPIVKEKRVVGVLDVQSDKLSGLSEEDANLLRSLANQIAVALTNAQLYQIEHELRQAEAERAQELAKLNADLKAAQAELLRQERLATLGKLTATVSHEIRNPLATIRASAFALDRKTRDKGLGVEQALDRIERNITRCDNIIIELLDYTRIGELDLQQVCFDDWLNQFLDEQEFPAGITLVRELNAGTKIWLDPQRFRRVIINLFDNACQAMLEYTKQKNNKTPLILGIQAAVVGQRLKISISDSGPGIAPEIIPHIFEPLYSTKGFGVGLGLPVVKEIMKQHHGEIEIISHVGQGTQIILWLPLAP
ncbi:MAG: GAF domain-containing protein [Anaerolineae bacterium]|nr:GAF domain-containing protein [Anaerolineae bacterium]